MTIDQGLTKTWRRPVRVVFWSMMALVLLALCLLRFGNPQWHKWVYLFQAKYSPGSRTCYIPPPPNYTGVWTLWLGRGQAREEQEYINGVAVGPCVHWHSNGRLAFVADNNFGVRYWYPSGSLAKWQPLKEGIPHGKCITWHEDGIPKTFTYYDDGEVVKEEHFGAEQAHQH